MSSSSSSEEEKEETRSLVHPPMPFGGVEGPWHAPAIPPAPWRDAPLVIAVLQREANARAKDPEFQKEVERFQACTRADELSHAQIVAYAAISASLLCSGGSFA